MIVLDATVLVYAKGSDHPLRDPCRQLIKAVEDGDLFATTTPEVLQEFAHIRSRQRGRADAACLAQAYADLFSPLLAVEEAHLRAGLLVFEKHSELGSFDSVLAATASLAGADALVSADRAFSVLDFPRHVVPDAKGLVSLLKPAQ
jgi:predicted nucleic acid-binding protein